MTVKNSRVSSVPALCARGQTDSYMGKTLADSLGNEKSYRVSTDGSERMRLFTVKHVDTEPHTALADIGNDEQLLVSNYNLLQQLGHGTQK